MLMTAAEYRESLRRLKPRVFVDGRAVASVADDPALQPGVNAVGLTYDFALRDDTASLMRVGAADGDQARFQRLRAAIRRRSRRTRPAAGRPPSTGAPARRTRARAAT